jgi:hypothetical protein
VRNLLTLAGIAFFWLGCSDRGMDGPGPGSRFDAGPVTGNDAQITGRDVIIPPTGDGCQKMDILFVVDDSGSMAEEQANLASNFPRFVEIINGFMTDGGAALDYRIGVTTTGQDTVTVISFPPVFPLPPIEMTEMGPGGALLQESSCGMSRRWIERADADVAANFSCIAQVGTSGSSMEMPLRMVELALTEKVADGTNAGFLREDALLAVVILTDENDCSRENTRFEVMIPDPTMIGTATAMLDACDPTSADLYPVERFLGVLDAVKGDRGRWAAAVIAGEGPGSCSSAFGDAVEATRLKDFVTGAGENAVFSSICEGDLTGALMEALTKFDAACDNFILI